jgi:LuxR family transcriptional regulator, activator of conjugal transfer of Ti plasmids
MSSQKFVFRKFAETLSSTYDETALCNVAQQVAADLGFNNFVYLRLCDRKPVCISSFPREWLSRYFKEGYERLDPVIRTAKSQPRPFAWECDDWGARGDGRTRSFFNEASDFGIKSGITIPIASASDQLALMTLSSNRNGLPPGREQTLAAEYLKLIGLYFHAHVDLKTASVLPSQVQCVLSQREAQCLEWASRGRTTTEVAEIISISARTVTFHLENARKKLNASNITQAVAIALRCNFIH